MNESKPLIAIVGAGIAGLSCASLLWAAGLRVVLFDKSRGPGGRMATRRSSPADGFLSAATFDHGAQYFTAKDPAFSNTVDSWQRQGIISPWQARFATITPDGTVPEVDSPVRYVATPTMSALGKQLAQPLGIKLTSTINHISYQAESGWSISSAEAGRLSPMSDASQGGFDHLLLAIPPTQALSLLGGLHPEFSKMLTTVEVAPCWAAMLEFPGSTIPDLEFDAAFIKQPDCALAFIAADHTKPGRTSGSSSNPASATHRWVLHASADWSRQHLEDSAESVAAALAQAFARITGLSLEGSVSKAHRWRYAKTIKPIGQHSLYDTATRLGICGDWCLGNNVESAWLSGRALAGELLKNMR